MQDLPITLKQQRRALGLTQGQLSELTGLSRASIVDLEAGKDAKLGVPEIKKLLSILDSSSSISPPSLPPMLGSSDPLLLAARCASVSYRDNLSAAALEDFLVFGFVASGYRPHISTLINEMPASLLIRAVKATAQRRHVKPRSIWKNLSWWSRELQTTREL